MDTQEAAIKVIEICNLGISHSVHYIRSDNDQKNRLAVNIRGAVDRLNALLEEMEE